jgi:hypothetical protein
MMLYCVLGLEAALDDHMSHLPGPVDHLPATGQLGVRLTVAKHCIVF